MLDVISLEMVLIILGVVMLADIVVQGVVFVIDFIKGSL